jgi:hypothetical protein
MVVTAMVTAMVTVMVTATVMVMARMAMGTSTLGAATGARAEMTTWTARPKRR